MTCRLGICTDSSTQLPSVVAERYGIEVVPITLTLDDVDQLDGVDVDADAFYARWPRGGRHVEAGAPSPGQFALAYETLLERGCTEIVSVHGPAPVGGVVQAARLAAHSTPGTVRVVDTGATGAGIACAVWSLAEAAQRGTCSAEAVAMTEQFGQYVRHFEIRLDERPPDEFGAALDTLVAGVLGTGKTMRAIVGHSDAGTAALADAIEAALVAATGVLDVVRYRIGPSAGDDAIPGLATCLAFSQA